MLPSSTLTAAALFRFAILHSLSEIALCRRLGCTLRDLAALRATLAPTSVGEVYRLADRFVIGREVMREVFSFEFLRVCG